jgi:hypothetical protein
MKNMKKIIFYLIAVVFVFAACEEQDNLERYDLGTEFFVSDGGITSLDSKVTINVLNQPKNISTIEVFNGGDKIGDMNLTDGTGSVEIEAANIGLNDIDDEALLKLQGVADNGNPIERFHYLVVENPISITEPGLTHNYDSTFYLMYRVETYSVNVDSVVVMGKINDGNYDVVGRPDMGSIDSVAISPKALSLQIGDIVHVKVIAYAGAKSAVTETEMVVNPCSYQNENIFKLDTTANMAYDLIEARMIESTTEYGDSADVAFSAGYSADGPLKVGFKSPNNAEFIVGTDDDYMVADKISIEEKDFSSAVSAVEDAKPGDVYIYRTKRGSDDYVYGVMKVKKVSKPEGVLEDSCIALQYKH